MLNEPRSNEQTFQAHHRIAMRASEWQSTRHGLPAGARPAWWARWPSSGWGTGPWWRARGRRGTCPPPPPGGPSSRPLFPLLDATLLRLSDRQYTKSRRKFCWEKPPPPKKRWHRSEMKIVFFAAESSKNEEFYPIDKSIYLGIWHLMRTIQLSALICHAPFLSWGGGGGVAENRKGITIELCVCVRTWVCAWVRGSSIYHRNPLTIEASGEREKKGRTWVRWCLSLP